MIHLAFSRIVGSLLLAVSVSTCLAAELAPTSAEEQMRFFENRIRPLLVQRCYECHANDKVEGGLRLDVVETISQGGDSGPVIVPGDPASSLLVSAVRYEDLEMPPDAPLSDQEKADLEVWIKQGAYWPITQSQATDTVAQASWWAAAAIDPGIVPDPTAGIDSQAVIDRYIDQALDEQGLHRAPPTDRARLIRRLSFDLLGLPPTPDAIDRFVHDGRADAYQRLVDGMFADPAYGERMARLWLDLVRYAESDGWRADEFRPQAWRYRDFVVAAFNSKLPYDRFVALQLAGDEIAPADEQALAAVGYYRLGIYEFNQRDAEGHWQNIVDEITDVTADVFLATGMACAKCHDHKFDPIPRADYFRLRSVFEPLLFVDRKSKPATTDQDKVNSLLSKLAEVEGRDVQQLSDGHIDRFLPELQAMFRKVPEERNSYEHQIAYLIDRQVYDEGLSDGKVAKKIGKERNQQREDVLKELQAFNADPYSPADLLTIIDAPGDIRPTRLPGRTQGTGFEPGPPSVYGVTTFAATPPLDAPTSSGRRTELAKWITSPENPVAARVLVNRLWQYHFDTGLASGPNDFGRLGEPPSHPRLLDYLAKRLIDSSWNIQAIQREIVCSQTYRQSAIHPAADQALSFDASNRLLWHKSVRRLDAEQYRDTLLVAMNSLVNEVGGPSTNSTNFANTRDRRSIYLKRFRNSSDEILAALDAPPGIVGTAKRDVTTTATQSLMMLNHPRLVEVASRLAARVREEIRDSNNCDRGAMFIRRAHLILTGLEPDEATVLPLLLPLVNAGQAGEVDACHVLLNSNAFLFVD